MAKNVTESEYVKEIRTSIEGGKLIMGTETTIKELKKGTLKKILVSSNCPENVREDLDHYSSMGETSVEDLHIQSDELGVLCKKPFSVSIVGISK